MGLIDYEVVKGLIIYNDKYLILERKDLSGGRFEIPGGRKEGKETDNNTLCREIKEEVGLETQCIRLLNTWILDLPEKGLHLHGKTYLCTANSNKVKLGKEHSKYQWLTKEEILALDIPDWLRDAISKIAS